MASAAQAEDIVITAEARTHFQQGVAFVDDPDGARFQEAYREFKAAYALSPSWKILGNLGLAALKLERDGEAIAAYTKYLAEGGDQIDPAERAQVERDIQTLQSGLTRVTLSSSPPNATLVDERLPDAGATVINRYLFAGDKIELALHPGRHRITARLDGYVDETWSIDATASGSFEHAFALQKGEVVGGTTAVGPGPGPVDQGPALNERPIPTSVFILGGLSVALAGGGAVTGLLAKKKHDDYAATNGSLSSETARKNAKELKDSGERLNLIADALFAGAIVGAGVTIVLYATRPERTKSVGGLRLTPLFGARGGGASLHGSF